MPALNNTVSLQNFYIDAAGADKSSAPAALLAALPYD